MTGVVTDVVPGLNLSTVPGTKVGLFSGNFIVNPLQILLIPRVLCRRRCIRLTTQNCKVLGGCSELLMGQNWPSLRVLCRMLQIDYRTAMEKAS